MSAKRSQSMPHKAKIMGCWVSFVYFLRIEAGIPVKKGGGLTGRDGGLIFQRWFLGLDLGTFYEKHVNRATTITPVDTNSYELKLLISKR